MIRVPHYPPGTRSLLHLIEWLLGMTLCFVTSGCSSPEQTNLNSPLPTIHWTSPRLGATYIYMKETTDSLAGQLDSTGRPTHGADTCSLTFERVAYQPPQTQSGINIPSLQASRFAKQDMVSGNGAIYIAVDSNGDFWLGDGATEWTRYPGVENNTGLLRPPVIVHREDSTGSRVSVTSVRTTLGWTTLKEAGRMFDCIIIRDSGFSSKKNPGPSPTTTYFQFITTYWIAPTIGCYVRDDYHATEFDPDGSVQTWYSREDLTKYSP